MALGRVAGGRRAAQVTLNAEGGLESSEVTPGKTTAEWLALCDEAEIPCMPIVDINELMTDEHLQAVGMFEAHHHPSEGETVLARPPVKFSKTPSAIRSHAPRFGEHGSEVLRELGYDEDSIVQMREAGVLLLDDGA